MRDQSEVPFFAIEEALERTAGKYDGSITREQFAVILYRYAVYKGYDTAADGAAAESFRDADQVSGWAEEAVAWAVDAGLLTGKGNQTLDPAGTATRAEAAQLLQRFAQLAEP